MPSLSSTHWETGLGVPQGACASLVWGWWLVLASGFWVKGGSGSGAIHDKGVQVEIALWPGLGDQVTVDGLFDGVLHKERIFLETGFEDFSLGDHTVEDLIGRVGAVEELVVECVKGLDPCFDEDVEVVIEGVLIGKNLRRNTGVFGDGDAVRNHGIDGVFEGTEGITVGGEEGNALECWVCQCLVRWIKLREVSYQSSTWGPQPGQSRDRQDPRLVSDQPTCRRWARK